MNREADHPKLQYRCPAWLKQLLAERAKADGLLPSVVVCALIESYVNGEVSVGITTHHTTGENE